MGGLGGLEGQRASEEGAERNSRVVCVVRFGSFTKPISGHPSVDVRPFSQKKEKIS